MELFGINPRLVHERIVRDRVFYFADGSGDHGNRKAKVAENHLFDLSGEYNWRELRGFENYISTLDVVFHLRETQRFEG